MERVIDPSRVHHAWNRDRDPTLRIADGDSVRFALRMAGAEQIREGDSYADTHFIIPELIAGARVEVASYKKDPADFVLWKPSPDGMIGVTRSDIYNGMIQSFVPFTKLDNGRIVGTHNAN